MQSEWEWLGEKFHWRNYLRWAFEAKRKRLVEEQQSGGKSQGGEDRGQTRCPGQRSHDWHPESVLDNVSGWGKCWGSRRDLWAASWVTKSRAVEVGMKQGFERRSSTRRGGRSAGPGMLIWLKHSACIWIMKSVKLRGLQPRVGHQAGLAEAMAAQNSGRHWTGHRWAGDEYEQ